MCSTAQRQGPETTQTGSDTACCSHAAWLHVGHMLAPESLTCLLCCQHRRHVFLVSILCLTVENGSHITRLNTYFIVSHPWHSIYWVIFCAPPPSLFLFSIRTVYLKNALSHITEFSICSIMSLESVVYLIHRFIPKLEVKQTPDKAVALGQLLL